MSTNFVTRKQLSLAYNVKPRTIVKWEKKGILEVALRVNGRPRYNINMLDKIITKHKHKPAKKDGLLTRKEVAEILKVTYPTLKKWRDTGVLKACKIGGAIRYKQSEIDKAVNDVA